jgi:hypothetical protein
MPITSPNRSNRLRPGVDESRANSNTITIRVKTIKLALIQGAK